MDEDSAVTFRASLDGGATWAEVPEGIVTELGHSGSSLVLEATMARAGTEVQGDRLHWLIAYAL